LVAWLQCLQYVEPPHYQKALKWHGSSAVRTALCDSSSQRKLPSMCGMSRGKQYGFAVLTAVMSLRTLQPTLHEHSKHLSIQERSEPHVPRSCCHITDTSHPHCTRAAPSVIKVAMAFAERADAALNRAAELRRANKELLGQLRKLRQELQDARAQLSRATQKVNPKLKQVGKAASSQF